MVRVNVPHSNGVCIRKVTNDYSKTNHSAKAANNYYFCAAAANTAAFANATASSDATKYIIETSATN